jgi:iron-sulfur cluster repair protein YtfE (RIC family)
MKSLYLNLLIPFLSLASDQATMPTSKQNLKSKEDGITLAYEMAINNLNQLDLSNNNPKASQELKSLISSIIHVSETACKASLSELVQQQQTIEKLQKQNEKLSRQLEELTKKKKKTNTILKNIKHDKKRDSVGYSADIE